jgi:transcriptional regulator with GAF, ATPase, and Fis domain
VFPLDVPPLRDRTSDIAGLAQMLHSVYCQPNNAVALLVETMREYGIS